MVGGAIRGFNLPLVLAGLIVGALLMHWRLGRRTIEAIECRRRLPDEAFAGQPFTVRFLVTNHNGWLPAWLIRIDDRIQMPATPSPQKAARKLNFGGLKSMSAVARDSIVQFASCGIGRIGTRRTLAATYDCIATKRGRYEFGPLAVSTGMPLGLMIAKRSSGDTQSMYVYPKLVSLRRDWRRRLQSRSGGMSTTARRSGASDGDFFGLRSWQAGDSQRWIHWRTTARIGEPAVRQFEQQRKFDLCVLVDGYWPVSLEGSNGDTQRSKASDDFEFAVSAAAALVTHIVPTPTNRVALAVAGVHNAVVASGGTRDQLTAMLKLLADVEPSAEPDLMDAIDKVFRSIGRPQDLVVVSPRTIPALGEKMIAMLSGRCSMRWYAVADGSIDVLVERPRPAVIETDPWQIGKALDRSDINGVRIDGKG